MLAGLVRCVLASMDYAGGRGVQLGRLGTCAAGTVTRRDDGVYGFVAIDATLDVRLAPSPEPEVLGQVAKAQAGCFVGNSLIPKRYHWTVNGEEVP